MELFCCRQILSFDNSIDGPTAEPGRRPGVCARTADVCGELPSITTNCRRSLLRWSRFLLRWRSIALGEYMTAMLQGSELPEAKEAG